MGITAAVGASVGLAALNGESTKNAASFNKQVGDANASMLEQQAARQQKIGEQQAQNFRKQVAGTVGSQRAALAAQGVDVNDGSALEIQEQTRILGAEDARTIQTNAYLEALGMKTQAASMRLQGQFGQQAAANQVQNSILTAGIQGYMQTGGFNPQPSRGSTSSGMASGTSTAGGSYGSSGNIA